MSSYWYKYQSYNAYIFTVLNSLAALAALLILGWYLLRAFTKRSNASSLYQNLYLAACASIYIFLLIAFF